MNKRNWYVTLSAIALLLLIGVAFAAATGILNFSGAAKLSNNVDLNIIEPAVTDVQSGESATVTADGKTLNFTTILPEPGDTRYVTFKIENVGNVDAVLGSLSSTVTPAPGSGIEVTWPSLNGVTVDKGDTSVKYTIEVHWDENYKSATQNVSFSATINYQQAAAA